MERISGWVAGADPAAIDERLHRLVERNATIYDEECINLNPAANVMNPRAEALLSSGLGSRPSLGYPGDKYEMGLEAIEQIEVLAAELVAEVFDASYAEVRVGSGAMANLYAFMATCRPGDPIIVPPATIGGHVTHNTAGAAGLYRLDIHEAPVDADRYTIDVERLAHLAARVRPKLITVGSSLNLTHHPVADLRQVADDVGAILMFDAAHLSGLIAGNAWPNPLQEGAHVMTMSAYKSLAGPPSGVLVTADAAIAERVDAIAFPGLTANFDVANTAALALTMLDWQVHGQAYARTMIETARALAGELAERGVLVWKAPAGATASHAFAIDVGPDGGHATARHLRRANLLISAIGLPHDAGAGVRVGTNEAVRRGMGVDDMPEVADLMARALAVHDDETSAGDDVLAAVAAEVSALRRRFTGVHFTR